MADKKEIIESLESLKNQLLLQADIKGYGMYVDGLNEAIDYIKTSQFRTEYGMICWLSAYYPAPKRSMIRDYNEHKRNGISWMKFLDEMRISQGEATKYDETIKEFEKELMDGENGK